MAAYCNEQGLNYQTFMYYVLRIKKYETVAADGNSFVQIKMIEKTTAGIRYHIPNGVYFVFPVGCAIQLIRSLIG